MNTASVATIRKDLRSLSREELTELVLSLARFKKDNKELLSYLLYEAHDELSYVAEIKQEIDLEFSSIKERNLYFFKKGARKILRSVKKYIRYSKNKQTEAELLIHYCWLMMESYPNLQKSRVLSGMYETQMRMAQKAMEKLHEDLQFDLNKEMEEKGLL